MENKKKKGMTEYVDEKNHIHIVYDDKLIIESFEDRKGQIIVSVCRITQMYKPLIRFFVNKDAELYIKRGSFKMLEVYLYKWTSIEVNARYVPCFFKTFDYSKLTIGKYSSCRERGRDTYELNDKSRLEFFGNDDGTNTITQYDESKAVISSGVWDAYLLNLSQVVFDHSSQASVVAFENDVKISAHGTCFLKIDTVDNPKVEASGFASIALHNNDLEIKKVNFFGSVIRPIQRVNETIFVYKKLGDNRICKLILESGQTFQSEYHTECITDRAIVESIYKIDEHGKKEYFSDGAPLDAVNLVYKVGETVVADSYSGCGVRFFLTEKEAIENAY